MTREELLAALTARIDAEDGRGGPGGVRAPEAGPQAESLLGLLATERGVDPEVLRTLGVFHWTRAAVAGPHDPVADREADAALAATLLMPLALTRPDALPEAVRASFATAAAGRDRTHVHAEALSDLAMLLMRRGIQAGESPAMTAALRLLRTAAHGLPPGHPSRPVVLCNLGYALLLTGIAAHDPAAPVQPGAAAMPHVDEALRVLREAFDTTQRGHLNYARCANGLAQALRAKAFQSGDREALGEAIGHFRTAVATATEVDDNLPQIHADLGSSLLMWADSDHAAVNEAVTALANAVALSPEDAPELPERLDLLAGALQLRYDEAGAQPGDLRQAAAVLRRLLAATPPGSPEHPLRQARLGLVLVELEHRRIAGDLGPDAPGTDVDEPVRLLREALAALPEDSPERIPLGLVLERAVMQQVPKTVRERHDPATRRRMDAIDAVAYDAFAPGRDGPDGPGGELAGMLALAFRLLGAGAEDDGSRNAQLMDMVGLLMNYPRRAGLEDVIAAAMDGLQRQFEHLDPAERPQAIARFLDQNPPPARRPDPAEVAPVAEACERALRELPPDHEHLPLVRLIRLQLRMVDWLRPDAPPTEERLAAMTEAITEAMTVLPEILRAVDIPWTALQSTVVMGTALASPFEALAQAEEHLRRQRRELSALTPGTPEHTAKRTALANTLFHHFELLHDEPSYAEGRELARELVAASLPPDPMLVCAWGRAVVARIQHPPPEAGEDAIPSSGMARLASDQAAHAASYRDGPGALEALEEGRAYLLSKAISTRREAEALRRADPRLADRFAELRARLSDFGNPGLEPRPAGDLQRYRDLAREWHELVGRIQALPDFDRFLLPLPLGVPDLRAAAAEGPVVTVNVNHRRCDALALTRDGVRLVELPALAATEVAERAEAFHDALGLLTGGRGGALAAGQARQTVTDTLGWLWEVLAEPVLTALGFAGPVEHGVPWPRLWWSPTGALTFLPVHAAGHHGEAGASVLDRVASSYTPNVRALMHARSHRVPEPGARSALAVAMPETPGHAPLPRTVGEAATLTARLPGPGQLTGPAATRQAVLAALPAASVAHFACHAASDRNDPAASHLLLHDGPLSVTELSRLHLNAAELAYLSACGTARGGTRLADEAVHAVSAFQLAGYAQAVGTLWEIGDDVAARVAAEVHRELAPALPAPGRLPAALALHAVTRRMRQAAPRRPWTWAALVHSGA
ncbi:CHAT domain-containing protein [Streptomyces sp. 6N223]|uniref:CHAT domain-containing protein n=1 Tax=Streptomyces sp. 6N223 TaxID=3457412 RepID=UPI003FD1C536